MTRYPRSKTGVFEMRRHYSSYFKGIQGFKDYRIKLVIEDDPEAVKNILSEIRENFADYAFA